jgi:hypothetical protein
LMTPTGLSALKALVKACTWRLLLIYERNGPLQGVNVRRDQGAAKLFAPPPHNLDISP